MTSEIQLEVIWFSCKTKWLFLRCVALVIRSFGISKSNIAPIVSEFYSMLMDEISFICLPSKKVMYANQY